VVQIANCYPSVNAHVASVSAFTPVQKSAQSEARKQDAQERTTVWDAEPSRNSEKSPDEWVPMGTRIEGGDIVPFTTLPRQPGLGQEMDVDTGGATQERSIILPPTQKVDVGINSPERSIDSLPPSDFPPESSQSDSEHISRILQPMESPDGSDGTDCDCHLTVDDESMLCEGRCKKWYHIWYVIKVYLSSTH
jgi:hypothetical protein